MVPPTRATASPTACAGAAGRWADRGKRGEQSERYVDVLRQTIEQFRPDMIWWDELFLSGISSEPQYRGAIAALLEDLYGGLGRCCDLINHCHPAVLDRGTAAERAGVFCCPAPAAIAPPRPHGRRRQGVGRSATTPATSIGPGC